MGPRIKIPKGGCGSIYPAVVTTEIYNDDQVPLGHRVVKEALYGSESTYEVQGEG